MNTFFLCPFQPGYDFVATDSDAASDEKSSGSSGIFTDITCKLLSECISFYGVNHCMLLIQFS